MSNEGTISKLFYKLGTRLILQAVLSNLQVISNFTSKEFGHVNLKRSIKLLLAWLSTNDHKIEVYDVYKLLTFKITWNS